MAKASRQPEPRTQLPASLSGWVTLIQAVLFLRVVTALIVQLLPASTFAFTAPVARLPYVGELAAALASVLVADLYGAVLDLLLFVVTYYFAMDVVAGMVLPVRERDVSRVRPLVQSAEARALSAPVVVASNGAFDVRGMPPARALGPGVILCDGVTALTLEGTKGARRVIGPGLNWLLPEERVQAAVDLRPIQMVRTATGTTREGMQVEVEVSITVEIGRDQERLAHHAHYPFDPGAVLKALYAERAQAVDPTTDARPSADWCEITGWQVEDGLRRVVAAYTIDQLFAVDRPDVNPRHDMEGLLLRLVNPEIEPYGATCTDARITGIRPPRAVLEQRIRTWCAEWKAREESILELGRTQQDQAKQSSLTTAQDEVYPLLIKVLEVPLEQATIENISRRVAAALAQMAREPDTNALLNAKERDAISRIANLTRSGPGAPGGNA